MIPFVFAGEAAPILVLAASKGASYLTVQVRGQAPVVRHAVRVVKEWAAHQAWSSQYHTPPPVYLELVVVHCATEFPDDATSVGALVQRVHAELRRAEELVITWKKAFAWYEPPAGLSAPTVLDPFHPVRNYADPAAFDASELARFAKASAHLLGTCALERPRSESGDSFISASGTTSAASTSDVSTAPSTPLRG